MDDGQRNLSQGAVAGIVNAISEDDKKEGEDDEKQDGTSSAGATPPEDPDEENTRVSLASSKKNEPFKTEKEARAAAKANGWRETKEISHGAKVYRDPKTGSSSM